MSRDINQVVQIGRLTRDMELKYTSGGTAIGRISLANGYRTKKGDQWEDRTNFFDVNLFGKQAESLQKFLVKGTQICVAGELRHETWEQDGQKRSTVKIIAGDIQLLARANGAQGQPGQAPEDFHSGEQFDDDIPF